ncbi:MAG: hypothetical protein LBV67_02105, partial [Streptococcaceae bacterium]|nr:hypothetical protein [Streptococcaceae bacterium]
MIENNVFNMIRQSLMNKNLPFFRMFTINGEKLFEQFNCCYLKTLAHLDEWEEAISSVSSQTLLIMGKKENLLHFFDFSGLLYYQKKIYINEKKVGTLIFGGFLLEDHHCPIDKNEKIIEKMSKRTIEEITDKVKEINEEINELTSYFPKLLLEIIEKLKQNFTHNYTLSELSRYFFVHETTINRLFKKYTN